MKRLLLESILWIGTCVVLFPLTAYGLNDSTSRSMSSFETHPKAKAARYFENISLQDQLLSTPDPIQVPVETLADTVLDQRLHAHSLLQKVITAQRFIETLDALSEIELPVGVVKSGGPVDYSILIDRMTFTTTGAIMDVYVSLALPQSGERIAFHGKVPLSKEGGIAGNAKVFLVGDHHINLGGSQLTIKGSKNTYVEFDCGGFKGVSIEALVQFSRELIVPEN